MMISATHLLLIESNPADARLIKEALRNDDVTTSRMLKEILAMKESHADELADWLDDFPSSNVSELIIN